MGELYKLTFRNGKSYIGIAVSGAHRRFLNHRRAAIQLDRLLYNAWRKHGEPILKVLAVIEDQLLHKMEVKAISAYRTFAPDGYNLTRGGEGTLGTVPSPEKLAKISASLTGKVYSAEHLAQKSARISAAKLGKKLSPEHCAKLSAVRIGHPTSPETRAKIGAANSNPSLETRAKMSASMKGKSHGPCTPERRLKASVGMKRSWANRKAKHT